MGSYTPPPAAAGSGVPAVDLASTTDVAKGAALVGFKPTNEAGSAYLANTVGLTAARVISERPSVRQWGARPDGSDAGPGFNAAIAALGTNGWDLYVPAGTYTITTPITLPVGHGPLHTRYCIYGHGARLYTTAAITIMSDSVPANTTAAVDRTNRTFDIHGLTFEGSQNNAQRGLAIQATYGSSVRNCSFVRLGTGLDLIFNLMTEVQSCLSVQNTQHAFRSRSGIGVWGDATGGNSGSNSTIFRSCRDFAQNGQLTQFYIQDSSGGLVENCICEGGNTVDAVKFDGADSTTAQNFMVRGLHSENVPSGAILRLRIRSNATVEQVFSQPNSLTILIDSSGSSAGSRIHIRDIPHLSNIQFKNDSGGAQGNVVWGWENETISYGQIDLTDPTYWVGGVVPYYLTATQRSLTDLTRFTKGYPNNAPGFPQGLIAGGSDQNHAKDYQGTGTPLGVVNAQVGSTFRRRDGGAGTCFYVKESGGTGSSGWVAK